MYQFRVRKDDEIIEYLDNINMRNSYLVSLIKEDAFPNVLKLKDIKRILKKVLNEFDIKEIYLFGSYARGEANANSDVDILCDKGNIKTLNKVKFKDALPDEKTKGESVEFTTTTIEGTLMKFADGSWSRTQTFSTYNEAIAYLEGLLAKE